MFAIWLQPAGLPRQQGSHSRGIHHPSGGHRFAAGRTFQLHFLLAARDQSHAGDLHRPTQLGARRYRSPQDFLVHHGAIQLP